MVSMSRLRRPYVALRGECCFGGFLDHLTLQRCAAGHHDAQTVA